MSGSDKNNLTIDDLLQDRVEAIEVRKERSISELLDAMAKTGFQGKNLAKVTDVLEEMINEKDLTIFLGYAGSLSTTGQWKIINWLLENRYVDVLIPTGANISEDIIDAMGFDYWQGSHLENNEVLFREGMNRYYDVYGKESDYLEMTELLAEFILTLDQDYQYSSREFLKLCGEWLIKRKIKSIVAVAHPHRQFSLQFFTHSPFLQISHRNFLNAERGRRVGVGRRRILRSQKFSQFLVYPFLGRNRRHSARQAPGNKIASLSGFRILQDIADAVPVVVGEIPNAC